MIKNQIHEAIGIANENTFLPCLKTEPAPQFQEKTPAEILP
jgi:hypothetical protein